MMNVFNNFESVFRDMQMKAYFALVPSPVRCPLLPSHPGEHTTDFRQLDPDVKDVKDVKDVPCLTFN